MKQTSGLLILVIIAVIAMVTWAWFQDRSEDTSWTNAGQAFEQKQYADVVRLAEAELKVRPGNTEAALLG